MMLASSRCFFTRAASLGARHGNASVLQSPAAALAVPVRSCTTTPGKVKVNATTSDGTTVDFEAPVGVSLMVAIRDSGELFIEQCCRGVMKCTTCHVYVDPAWFDAAGGAPCDEEQDMLDQAIDPRDNSRLSCQIALTKELDGIAVSLPDSTVNLMFGAEDPTGLGRGKGGASR